MIYSLGFLHVIITFGIKTESVEYKHATDVESNPSHNNNADRLPCCVVVEISSRILTQGAYGAQLEQKKKII